MMGTYRWRDLTLAAGIVAVLASSSAVSVANAARPLTVFVDDRSPAGGDGSAASPFNDLHHAVEAAGPGAAIVVRRGSGSPHAQGQGVTLQDGQSLSGPATVDGGIRLANDSTIRGLTITSNGAPGISGDGVGGVTIDNVGISSTGAPGIDIRGSEIQANFSSIDIQDSNGDGINLDSTTGTFTFSDSVIASNAAGNGIGINNSSAQYEFSGGVDVNGAGDAGISIQGTSGAFTFQEVTVVGAATNGIEIGGAQGGSVDFSGPVNVQGAGQTGIDILGTQAPITFDSLDVGVSGNAGAGISLTDSQSVQFGEGGVRVSTSGNSGIDIADSTANFDGPVDIDAAGGNPLRFSGNGDVGFQQQPTFNGQTADLYDEMAQVPGAVTVNSDGTFTFNVEPQVVGLDQPFTPPPSGISPIFYTSVGNTDELFQGPPTEQQDRRMAAAQITGAEVASAVTPGPGGEVIQFYSRMTDNSDTDPAQEVVLSAFQSAGSLVPGPAGQILAYQPNLGSTAESPGLFEEAQPLIGIDPLGNPEPFISVPDGRDPTVQLMIVVEIQVSTPGRDRPPPPPDSPSLWSAFRRVFSFRGLNASASRGNAVWRSSAPTLRPAPRRVSNVVDASGRPLSFEELPSNAQGSAFQMFLTNVGNSTGEAFTGHFLNNGEEPVDLDVKGLVVEPLKEEAQQFVQQQLQQIMPQNPISAQLDAYCLEFLRLPPQAEQMFQLAPQGLQDQFSPIRDLLDVSKQLNSMGLLPADSDPASYFHAINQWAIWTKEEGFSLDSFTDAFVDHTREQIEAAGNQWTSQFDEVLRGAAPGRWANITRILDAVGR